MYIQTLSECTILECLYFMIWYDMIILSFDAARLLSCATIWCCAALYAIGPCHVLLFKKIKH